MEFSITERRDSLSMRHMWTQHLTEVQHESSLLQFVFGTKRWTSASADEVNATITVQVGLSDTNAFTSRL